jgi:hypothetical protein
MAGYCRGKLDHGILTVFTQYTPRKNTPTHFGSFLRLLHRKKINEESIPNYITNHKKDLAQVDKNICAQSTLRASVAIAK